MDIATLRAHAATYIKERMAALDASYHTAVNDFANFVEGRDAEAKAVTLLTGKGYTVTPPPTVTPLDEGGGGPDPVKP